jgi:small subunit ribosomal protein S16
VGSKKNPIWRVVVADQRSPRDGRFIETIGHYNPQTEPSTIRIDADRYDHWVGRGAQASNTVKQLMKAQTKSGGPTPLEAPAAPAPVVIAEDEASEAVAEAAVVAGATDAELPAEADEPAAEEEVEAPTDEAAADDDAASGDEPGS